MSVQLVTADQVRLLFNVEPHELFDGRARSAHVFYNLACVEARMQERTRHVVDDMTLGDLEEDDVASPTGAICECTQDTAPRASGLHTRRFLLSEPRHDFLT